MPEFSISNPSEAIHIQLHCDVLILTIARGGKKNALTHEMYTALDQALQAADKDKNIRALIITGHTDYFTAGNDILDFLNKPPTDESSPVLQFLKSLSTLQKPLVAAASGVAVGVGTTLLLHCDYVILRSDAVLKLPFVELGLCPEAASSLLLPRSIGYLRASEMILTGATLNAPKALEWGLANEIAEDPLLRAQQIAEKLAKQPLASILLSKKLLKEEVTPLVSERLQVEGKEFVERLRSPEAREAFTAFMQKRQPDFKQF